QLDQETLAPAIMVEGLLRLTPEAFQARVLAMLIPIRAEPWAGRLAWATADLPASVLADAWLPAAVGDDAEIWLAVLGNCVAGGRTPANQKERDRLHAIGSLLTSHSPKPGWLDAVAAAGGPLIGAAARADTLNPAADLGASWSALSRVVADAPT